MDTFNFRIYFMWQGKRVFVDAIATSMESACEAVFQKYGYDLDVLKTVKRD